MPVKWTPETDQILLLKILETSQISVDVKAIAAAWPENMEAPTPRAISERLVKIRTTAKENGSAANFTVSSARKNGSAPSTPRKKATKDPVLKKAGGGGIKKKGIAKRKRAGKAENNNSEDSGSNNVDYEAMEEDNHAEEAYPQGEV